MKKNNIFSFLLIFLGGIIAQLNGLNGAKSLPNELSSFEIPSLARENSGSNLDVEIKDPKTGETFTMKMRDLINFLRQKSGLWGDGQKKKEVSERFIVRLWKNIKDEIRPTCIAVRYIFRFLATVYVVGNFLKLLADYHVPHMAIDPLVSGSVEVFVDGCSATFRAPDACVQLARTLFGPGGSLNHQGCITNPLLVYPGGPQLCQDVIAPALGASWWRYLSSAVSSAKSFVGR